MDLVGCDMVLGVQWLQSLGTVNSNFKNLTMKFSVMGQIITLQGLIST